MRYGISAAEMSGCVYTLIFIMSIWYKILLVGVSGGIGSVTRLLLQTWIHPGGVWMALSTWIINSLGCFIIGVCTGYLLVSPWGDPAKTTFSLLTMTGFCGGFSTFSEFTLDCVRYFEAGEFGIWIVFAGMTIFVGLFACAFGYWLGSKL